MIKISHTISFYVFWLSAGQSVSIKSKYRQINIYEFNKDPVLRNTYLSLKKITDLFGKFRTPVLFKTNGFDLYTGSYSQLVRQRPQRRHRHFGFYKSIINNAIALVGMFIRHLTILARCFILKHKTTLLMLLIEKFRQAAL